MPTNQFTHTSSVWVRYTDYEWRTAPDDKLYLTPVANAALIICGVYVANMKKAVLDGV